MQHMKILNSKEKKELIKKINQQWGADFVTDKAILKNEQDKLYLINTDISAISLDKLRINNMGLYIGQLVKETIRLSIEGSQLIGPGATKNILELSKEESDAWLLGEDLPDKRQGEQFVIVKHQQDFLGCGKITADKVLNYVGKNRAIHAVH